MTNHWMEMMTNPLLPEIRRPLSFTDLHWGRSADSERHNTDCTAYIDWLIERFHEQKCDSIIFCGDWFDNPVHVQWDTLWYSNAAIAKLSALGVPVYFIIGNHDLWFKNSRQMHAHAMLHNVPNFYVINDVTQVGDFLFCPYLMGAEYAVVANTKAKYVFGHFSFAGFMVNENYEMDANGGLNPDWFKPEYLFSGHFHKRQQKINANDTKIIYLGNTFPMDFNDAGDRERGCMVFDVDHGPTFLNWKDCPSYDYINLSDVLSLIELDQLSAQFGPKATIKVNNDIQLADPDLSEITDFLRAQGFRSIKVEEPEVVESTGAVAEIEAPRENITEFFFSGLNQVDTEGSKFRTPLLKYLFKSAQEKYDRGETV